MNRRSFVGLLALTPAVQTCPVSPKTSMSIVTFRGEGKVSFGLWDKEREKWITTTLKSRSEVDGLILQLEDAKDHAFGSC